MFINDLPLILSHCSVHLYADYTVIYVSNPHLTQIQNMFQSDFNALQKWLYSNNLLLNKSKSQTMIFGTKRMIKLKSNNLNVICNDGAHLHRADQLKYLGVWLDPELSFKPHIDCVLRKVHFGISVLYRSKNKFSFNVRKKLALQLILPFFDYADVVYQNTTKTNLMLLTTAYNKLCRFVIGCSYDTHHCIIYDLLKWFPLNIRRRIHWLQFIFKCIHFNYPNYLRQNLILYSSPYHLRHSAYYFFTPLVKKVFGKKAFRYKAPADWNNLPSNVRSLTSFYRFKKGLFSCFEISCNCFG